MAPGSAPKDLKDSDGKAVEARGEFSLVIVRTGIRRLQGYQSDCSFSLSQVRLLCCQKKDATRNLVMRGKNVYPIGYLQSAQQVQKIKLSEKITLNRTDMSDELPQGQGKWFDFTFEVPNNLAPYAIEFRQNSIAAVSPPVSAEKGLVTAVSIPASQCSSDYAEVSPLEGSAVYGTVLTAKTRLIEDLPLSIQNEGEWNKLQTDSSIQRAQFNDGKIVFVRAELKITGPEATATGQPAYNISALLKPLDGYNILALKCNAPAAGAVTNGQQLPVLVESGGRIHRPVGIIASGMSGEDKIYEIDYFTLTSDKTREGLVIG